MCSSQTWRRRKAPRAQYATFKSGTICAQTNASLPLSGSLLIAHLVVLQIRGLEAGLKDCQLADFEPARARFFSQWTCMWKMRGMLEGRQELPCGKGEVARHTKDLLWPCM